MSHTKLNENYKKELADLKTKMMLAEKFAKSLPVFSEKILEGKLSGKENWIQFGERYKGAYFNWGINRGLYKSGTRREITNYDGEEYDEYLFRIYINTLSIYDSHVKFGLEELHEKIDIFFYDTWNSTFYATDRQIEGLLDALCEWYKEARIKIVKHRKKEEIEALENKLEKLKDAS